MSGAMSMLLRGAGLSSGGGGGGGDYSSVGQRNAMTDLTIQREPTVFKTTGELLNKLIATGIMVVKYPRSGAPEIRKLSVNATLSDLLWADPNNPFKSKRTMKINEIREVRKGRNTKNFRAHRDGGRQDIDGAGAGGAELCLSIVTDDRTLDLKTSSRAERDLLIDCLKE